jgi:hypothetical protein
MNNPSNHMRRRTLMNGYRRGPEPLQFQDPPDRIRRLEDANTLWAEILSEPSTAIADLINIVDRALTLARANRSAAGACGTGSRTKPEICGTRWTPPQLPEGPLGR